MSAKSLRDKAVFATLGMVLLYGLAVLFWFVSAKSTWARASRDYAKQKAKFEMEKKKIAERQLWDERYEEAKSQMPSFASGDATDTTWLKMMDELALRNKVQISQRQGGEETQVDDVYELPIEVRNWEGSLEALVKFLYALENADKGRFSVCALNFKPSIKKGYLRGAITLKCAYMRD